MRICAGAMKSGLAGIALVVALVSLSEAVRAQAPAPGGLGVIEIRPWADGAGPSHIFWLTGNRFAVVDPLKSQILVYVEGSTSAEFAKDIPSDFSPYRLVRRAAEITIVDESERRMLRVPRDLHANSRELRSEPLAGKTVHVRRARVVRNADGAVTLRPAGRAPIKVLATGKSPYLASARELESDSAGNRYVLWKEIWCESPLEVQVFVGRYNRNGRLDARTRIPLEEMVKVGFDYAAISPSGSLFTIGYRHDKQAFVIEKFEFRDMQLRQQSTELCEAGDLPQDEPISSQRIEVEDMGASRPTANPDDVPDDPPASRFTRTTRKSILKRAREFLDATWTLHADNKKPPCPSSGCAGRFGNNNWVQPPKYRKAEAGSRQIGVSYDMGGTDSVREFRRKIEEERLTAGNISDYFPFRDSAGKRLTAGLDCSSFVMQAWGFKEAGPRTISTRNIESKNGPACKIAHVRSIDKLRPGDALNNPEVGHIRLFLRQEAPDGASLTIRVLEATSRCSGTCESRYEIDQFNGYIPVRYKGVGPCGEQGARSRLPQSHTAIAPRI
jgi:cell wall-associated NlpC family hydrolase